MVELEDLRGGREDDFIECLSAKETADRKAPQIFADNSSAPDIYIYRQSGVSTVHAVLYNPQ